MAMAKQSPPTASAFPPSVKYKVLKERNVDYMADFWARCRALYAGGPKLLENDALLSKVMPSHGSEKEDIYKERKKRAFYIPYPGSIVDKIVSELMAKPIDFEQEDTTDSVTDGGKAGATDSAESESGEKDKLPSYYTDLIKNCSQPGGVKQSLNQFAREQIFTALQCQTAWALVDLPKRPAEGYVNLDAQMKAGGLNAYVCTIDPECVIDWEEKEDGELAFVIIQDLIAKRQGIDGNRNMVTLRWRYFTETGWAVYEYTYDKTKKQNGPTDNEDIPLKDSGTHGFGRVPVRRMRLPDGLWAMGKLEAMARAHMNQRNALSWGQLKALFPVPVLYVQDPTPNNPITEDAGRVNQTHGQGHMRVLAEKDRLEYFSPDSAPYKIAMEDLTAIRDEMYRTLHSMAMSVDNSAAAAGRSADSKQVDQAAGAVVLKALGTYVREHLEDVLNLVATGRKDNIRIAAKGMDNFDDVTLTTLVQDAIGLSTVSIPSAHFQKKFKLKLAKLGLGSDITEEDVDKISKELEDNVTQDEFDAEAEAKTIGHEATAATAEATIEDPQGIKAAKALGKTKAPPPKSKKKPAKGKKKK
jgi:hypothetical protein